MVQWIGIGLTMQGLIPGPGGLHMPRATKAHALQCLHAAITEPIAATTEACVPRVRVLQQAAARESQRRAALLTETEKAREQQG